MKFITADELNSRDDAALDLARIAEEESKKTQYEQSIAKYIKNCWDEAKRAKENYVEQQILDNMRQIEGKYSSQKLNAIKQIGGSEVFMMITDAKVKNAFNWVMDIMFQPGTKPWGLEPTPVPDVPISLREEISKMAMEPLQMEYVMYAMQVGEEPTQENIFNFLSRKMPEIEKLVSEEILARAKEMGKDIEKKIDDKFIEGGWYDGVRKVIPNVVMHTGILKGPILKKRKVMRVKPDLMGRLTPEVTEELYPTYESRHPLYIYPAPGSTGVNDGYLIDRVKLTPSALQDLIGVPGYNDDEIYSVLEEFRLSKLHEWLTVDQQLADMRDEQSPLFQDSTKVDCLEFWGAVQGSKIVEWGVTTDPDGLPIDEVLYYNVKAYLIGEHVIGVLFNTHPMGHKPFYVDSFENRDGSFWGRGLPEIIEDVQSICNACARAIVNNVGVASGPQVERNIDRIPAHQRADKHLVPWKVWDVTETMMSSQPALKFYQPTMVVEKLMNVYNNFSKIADEHSGVPGFAHGDPNVGGAGNTASGLNMLMGGAARGIRALVSSIDENIIRPSVERQYFWLVSQEDSYGLICDYQVVTTGSSAAIIKEQMAQRRIEFMNMTMNPVDLGIMSMEGRKYLLEETAKSIQLNISRVLPPTPQQPPQIPGQPPPPGTATLDAAGNPVSGTDGREFGGGPTGKSGPPPSPAAGGGRRLYPQDLPERGFKNPPQRAGGGPVSAQPYIVGEQGPELFVPDQSGTIIPNEASVAAGAQPASNPMEPAPGAGGQLPGGTKGAMIDPWGDEMIPGDKGRIWSKLSVDQRAEDIMRVVGGDLSLGPNKDEAIRKYHGQLGNNPVLTAEFMGELMDNGDLPHFMKYDKPRQTAEDAIPRAGGGPVRAVTGYLGQRISKYIPKEAVNYLMQSMGPSKAYAAEIPNAAPGSPEWLANLKRDEEMNAPVNAWNPAEFVGGIPTSSLKIFGSKVLGSAANAVVDQGFGWVKEAIPNFQGGSGFVQGPYYGPTDQNPQQVYDGTPGEEYLL